MMETLADRVNSNERLLYRGRFVNTTFLLEIDTQSWLVRIVAGRVDSVLKGPFVMARWQFALRAPAEAWSKFWSPTPPPGFNDLFALIKQKLLRLEGDMHPFMSNLFYFKGALESLRGQR